MIKTLETIFYTRVWPTRYALALILAVAVTAWVVHPAHAQDGPITKTKVVSCSKSEAHNDGGVCVLHD